MSIYVMQRKVRRNKLQREMNAQVGGFVLHTSNSGRFVSECSTGYAKTPIVQKSFSQLMRTNVRADNAGRSGWKRMADSSSSERTSNLASEYLRTTGCVQIVIMMLIVLELLIMRNAKTIVQIREQHNYNKNVGCLSASIRLPKERQIEYVRVPVTIPQFMVILYVAELNFKTT